MGIFDDRVYDDLDDISKLVEPWTFHLNKLLDGLPDTIEVNAAELMRFINNGWTEVWPWRFNIDYDSVLSKFDLVTRGYLASMIDLTTEVEPGTYVDLETEKVVGGVLLRLNKKPIRDDSVCTFLSNHRCRMSDSTESSAARVKELIETLTGKATSTRSYNKLDYELGSAFRDLIANNPWRVRSDLVFIQLQLWAQDYIVNGTYSSYASILNVRCMVHYERPIYSAETIT